MRIITNLYYFNMLSLTGVLTTHSQMILGWGAIWICFPGLKARPRPARGKMWKDFVVLDIDFVQDGCVRALNA